MSKKKVTNKVKIDTSKYMNIETGELLSEEHEDISSVNKDTDLVIVHYNEYVIISSKAKEYIEREFSNVEAGRIFKMCDMVYGYYNVLSNKDKTPHTNATLSKELEYTRNKYAEFMKKLYSKSIIYYLEGMKDNKKCTWILLNPTLARKRKTIHKDVLPLFDDLSKMIQEENV